jgi:hypothetical protein
MRFSNLAVTVGLALTAAAAATEATATSPSLEATAGAGACGGSISCAVSQENVVTPATNASIVPANADSTLPDGSYANAHVIATFGALHVYSDAFRASGGDAQSSTDARVVDIIPADQIVNNTLNNVFLLNGSHSDVDHVFGNSAQVYISWDEYDAVTNRDIDSGIWFSSDTQPEFSFTDTVFVPTGHGVETHLELHTFTYSSFGVVDVADYHDTLDYYLTTAPGGPDVIGQSGHDYAPPAVPEPAAWAFMLIGFGGLGASLRFRRHQAPPVRTHSLMQL